MRIVILGNSGSGKSTLARAIARQHGLPALDLDTIFWAPDRVAAQRPDEDAFADLARFCDRPGGWVVEGCYAHLALAALAWLPCLAWLDPGLDACLANCRARPWEPHKYRTKAEQDAFLEPLLAWVADFYERGGSMSAAAHGAVWHGYAGPKQRLASRAEADDFLRAAVA